MRTSWAQPVAMAAEKTGNLLRREDARQRPKAAAPRAPATGPRTPEKITVQSADDRVDATKGG